MAEEEDQWHYEDTELILQCIWLSISVMSSTACIIFITKFYRDLKVHQKSDARDHRFLLLFYITFDCLSGLLGVLWNIVNIVLHFQSLDRCDSAFLFVCDIRNSLWMTQSLIMGIITHKRWIQLKQQNWSLSWNLSGCLACEVLLATCSLAGTFYTPKSQLVCLTNITYNEVTTSFGAKIRDVGNTSAILMNIIALFIGFYSLSKIFKEINNALNSDLEDHSENAQVFASGFKHVIMTITVLSLSLGFVFLGYSVAIFILVYKLLRLGDLPVFLGWGDYAVATIFHLNALFDPLYLMFRHTTLCPDFLKPVVGFDSKEGEPEDPSSYNQMDANVFSGCGDHDLYLYE